ncbi:MAG TPA: methyltransferase domain-containing protein [Gemmatimonadaceae bacterium]
MGLFERTRAWAGQGNATRNLRQRRYELFLELCRVDPHEPILDVGAGGGDALERFNRTNPIVAVDLSPKVDGTYLDAPNVTVEVGDGTALRFADEEFPVVFSNSVLEHIPRDMQLAFASEVRRVGRRYFVQTPNRYFPIEPHYQVPLFQFLPKRTQRWLNRHFTLGWRTKGHWEDVTLLSARDLHALFPDAEIRRERVFGMTKSLMAVRR